jgi:hypothetical protein
VPNDQLSAHLQVARYGDFTLTDAIRPALEVPIRPRQGYRVEIYRDRKARLRLPMLSAAVTAENVFDTLLGLIELVGDVVNVVLESSHGRPADQHQDLRRDDIDIPVLASHFCDFENLLVNDGCTGVAVMAEGAPIEVQFDEHKLFHVYAPDLKPFRKVLRKMGVRRRKALPLISEAEHLHHTTEAHSESFRQLCLRLGVCDFDHVFSDESYES